MSQAVHLIFLGPPGAGKGTQSQLIADQYQAAHVSTGDVLRSAVREGTPVGQQAKSYMDQGLLVPDAVLIDLIRDKLNEPGFGPSWIMDGFPRTEAQAEALEELLVNVNQAITVVLNVDVPRDLLIDRLTQRRTCRRTGQIFNLKFNPPDDPAKYDLYQRDDDQLDAVQNRLEVYDRQTQPLIDFYQQRGLLVTINGDQSLDAVKSEIIEAIEQKRAVAF